MVMNMTSEAFLGGSGVRVRVRVRVSGFVVLSSTNTYSRPFRGTFFRMLYHVICKEKM